MNFIRKLSTFFSIIEIYKYSALLLFIVMLVSALSEALGLGMIMPFLEVITEAENSSSGSVQYLSPVLKHFPDYYRLMVIGGLLVVLFLIKNVLFVLKAGLSADFVYRIRELWTRGIMEKYMYAEYPFLLSQKQGTLLNNLITEPGRAAKSLQQIIEFSSKAILAFALYGLLLFANWQITGMITFVAVVVVVLIRKATFDYSIGVGRKKVALSQQLTAIGAENINAIRQIKTFSLENEVNRSFTDKLRYLMRVLVRFYIFRNLPKPVTESLVVIGIVAVLVYLQYISEFPLSNIIPVIGLFIVTSQRFFPVVSQLYAERMNILTFIPSLKLVHELYSSDVKREELDRGVVISKLEGDIVLKDLGFSYEGTKPLFKNLNMTVSKGKVTAVVGPSGAGKSSIVDLLFGLLEPSEGEILINGRDLKEISLGSWRSMVGYVSQDTFLFNATVRENILVGKPGASEEEVVAAARKAKADDFIRRLPHGYDTALGDRGLKVSGGERQRIAVARVIVRDPEVLIFDEATSSLDPETERLIQESINDLAAQKTTIIISHRLSTVKNADVIYVMENGRVVETGSYKELENKRGRFYKMRTA